MHVAETAHFLALAPLHPPIPPPSSRLPSIVMLHDDIAMSFTAIARQRRSIAIGNHHRIQAVERTTKRGRMVIDLVADSWSLRPSYWSFVGHRSTKIGDRWPIDHFRQHLPAIIGFNKQLYQMRRLYLTCVYSGVPRNWEWGRRRSKWNSVGLVKATCL